jgi:hypothetical protein
MEILITATEPLDTVSSASLYLVETDEGLHVRNQAKSLEIKFIYKLTSIVPLRATNIVAGFSYLLLDVTSLVGKLSESEILSRSDGELKQFMSNPWYKKIQPRLHK